jgi:two-component sensor histidine kinase
MTDDALPWDELFKHLPAPCLVLDRNLSICAATDNYLTIVQRELDNIKGQYVFDAFPEQGERLAMFEDAFRRTLAGEATSLVKVPYSIPVTGNDGKPTGEMKEIWWTCHHNPLRGADGEVHYVIQKAQDVTTLVMAEQLKNAVTRELEHRVGNILSLVSAIVRRTVSSSQDFEDFMSKFDRRLMALSRSNQYLTGEHWDGMTLDTIISREIAACHELSSPKVQMSGPPVTVNTTDAQILTLAMHELATNSIKYGALKSPEGRLVINWTANGSGAFELTWRENGIDEMSDTSHSGFGSIILDRIVPAQLRGEAKRDFGGDSFVYQLSVADRAAAD